MERRELAPAPAAGPAHYAGQELDRQLDDALAAARHDPRAAREPPRGEQ